MFFAVAAAATPEQTGTIVVRVVTDPSPPGATWTYSGVGAPFQLGNGATEKLLSGLEPGTYRLAEAPTQAGQPSALTALACSDRDGNTRATLASASVSAGLEAGETVACTFTHRALGGRSAAAVVALARRYAPALRLSSGETYRPLRIEDYLGATTLHTGLPPRGPLLQPRPTLFTLPTIGAGFYLDVGGAEPSFRTSAYRTVAQRVQATRPRPTVYWHVTRQPVRARIAIEYWLLFLYNDFYDKHEGDWEGVTVFLENDKPLGISYSAHQGRRWSGWSSASRSGTHPIVYVARGSHATYARAGRYAIRVCWTLRGRHCAPTPKLDEATGSGPSLTPETYDLVEFGGAAYSGNWGSGNYVLGVGLTRDVIADPRRRSDYSFPFGAIPS